MTWVTLRDSERHGGGGYEKKQHKEMQLQQQLGKQQQLIQQRKPQTLVLDRYPVKLQVKIQEQVRTTSAQALVGTQFQLQLTDKSFPQSKSVQQDDHKPFLLDNMGHHINNCKPLPIHCTKSHQTMGHLSAINIFVFFWFREVYSQNFTQHPPCFEIMGKHRFGHATATRR